MGKNKTIDLTRVDGCYSKELREACNDIKLLLKDPTTDVEAMKAFVSMIVDPAKIEAEAKKRFRANLEACQTKQEIDELCYMAVLHGMHYRPGFRGSAAK
jgi:hypothetical protein